MKYLLAHAQELVYTLESFMPSAYQKETFNAMLGLFLEAKGYPLPQHSQTKSPSAISRFLNIYDWPTRKVIRIIRKHIQSAILSVCPKGRRPQLQVILDLTTLEKCGKFKEFDHLIRVYNRKRGLHLVVMYLVIGQWRIPWSFRVWRGKGTPSPAQLGLKLLKNLPKSLTKHFQVMVLADTAFGSADFIHGVRSLKYHAVTGLLSSRRLIDGRRLRRLHKQGTQVHLQGFNCPVWVCWFYLKRHDGNKEKRFVLSTRPMKASTINWWGKRRWQIEGWFKTAKHRFGLHRFGQGTLLGVYRWLVLSFITFILAHWAYLSTNPKNLPDWGEAAKTALEFIFPQILVSSFLLYFVHMIPLARSCGFDISISRCKM